MSALKSMNNPQMADAMIIINEIFRDYSYTLCLHSNP